MAGGLNKTPLFELHIQRGAKMAPFAGWNLPLHYYEGITDEHLHTRRAASVFDACSAGKFRLAGAGAAAALDSLLAAPVRNRQTGTCHRNFLLNEAGTVLADMTVYAMADEDFFVITDGACTRAVRTALEKIVPEDCALQDLTELLAKIDLLGPAAADVLRELDVPEAELPELFGCKTQKVADLPCILCRHPFAGEEGYELCFAADYAEDMWEIFLETEPVLPAGQGARDTLRLEMGIPLPGAELRPGTSLLQTGLAPLLQLTELPERDFPGKTALLAMGQTRQLAGIRLEGRRAGRDGSEVQAGGKTIGTVSSGAFAPSIGCAVALAWLDAAAAVPGTEVTVSAGDTALAGKIVELPFPENL